MSEKQVNGLRVAILATNGFEEAELFEPRKALDEAGARTTVVAPKSGKIQGMKHDEKSQSVAVDSTLANADPADFDAVLLPGRRAERRRTARGRRRAEIRTGN